MTSKVKVKVPSLTILLNRAASISDSLSFGSYSCASTVNAAVGVGHLVALCVSLPCSFPKCWMLNREIRCTVFKLLV